MLIEDMDIFCGILSDAYRDSYIEPSWDFCALDGKSRDLGYGLFKKKKAQVKALEVGKLDQLHFGCKGKVSDSITCHEDLFQNMKECFLPHGVITSGLQLKRAYFAWSWLLDDGGYVPRGIQNRLLSLKVQVDNRPLSKSEKKHISIQSIAQVVIYLSGNSNRKKIKDYIAKILPIAPTILCLDSLKSVRDYQKKQKAINPSDAKDLMRDIEKWITPVLPEKGKDRSKNNATSVNEVKLIPRIFEGDDIKTIHFPKLFLALTCITFMLVAREINPDQIRGHPILEEYRKNLPNLFHDLIDHHIQGAIKKSVAFFS